MDPLGDRPKGISSGKTWLNYSSNDKAKERFGGEYSGSSMVVRIHSLNALNLS